MAIKITVGEPKPQNEKSFPKLMIHRDGTITYFLEPKVGIHLNKVRDYFPEYYNTKCHTEISMAHYVDYNGPVTLQNEA